MRLVPYDNSAKWRLLAAPAAAFGATLGLSALLILAAHAPVLTAYALLIKNGFGSAFAWSETLTRATPLILTALSVSVAFRAKLYNIGAEGQLYAGALAAVAVGGMHGGTGWPISAHWLFPAMFVAAALGGALLLIVPTWLKTKFGVDEAVTTLLLNFITLLMVSLLLDGPLKDPLSLGWPQSVALNPDLELSRLAAKMRVTSGLAIAVVLAIGLYFVGRHTVLGFEIRAVGANPRAAEFAGMPVGRIILKTAVLSGALSGLAGAVEVAGRTSYVTLDMSPGYGYTGIAVAMLAGLHPLGIVAMAIFVAGILIGADGMSRTIGVPTYLADVMVALAVLSMLTASMLAKYRIRLK